MGRGRAAWGGGSTGDEADDVAVEDEAARHLPPGVVRAGRLAACPPAGTCHWHFSPPPSRARGYAKTQVFTLSRIAEQSASPSTSGTALALSGAGRRERCCG